MANLNIYTSNVGRKVATVSPGAAAAEAAGPYQTAAAVAGLGVAWAQWNEKNKAKDDIAAAAMNISSQAVAWERTQSEAQDQGFYVVNGEKLGLIEGRVAAFQEHTSQTKDLIGEIDDKGVRTETAKAYALQSRTDEIKIQQEFRVARGDAQKTAVALSVQQYSSLGQYDQARALLDSAAENGIFSMSERKTVNQSAISASRANDWRETFRASDDLEADIAAMQADPHLSEADKDELDGEVYSMTEHSRVEAERIETEIEEQNLVNFLGSTDPANVPTHQIAGMNLPYGAKVGLLKAKYTAANDPVTSDPVTLDAADAILMDVMLLNTSIDDAQIAIGGISGLAMGDKVKYIEKIQNGLDRVANNPQATAQKKFLRAEILGVPEDALNVLNEHDRSLFQLAAEMEREFNNLLMGDSSFNPIKWTDENKQRYLDRAERIQGLRESGKDELAVMDKGGQLDITATTRMIQMNITDPDEQEARLIKIKQQQGIN